MNLQQFKSIFTINGRAIGAGNSPYVIAELSANHNGSIDRAKAIMKASKGAGADAVKLQSYRPDTITLKMDTPEFQINDGLWAGYTLYDLYEWAHMPWEWHKPLFDYARSIDLTVFSSPFDFSAIDLLEDLNAPAYKIASFEAIDLPLIAYAAQTGKPLIISTGMANFEEIEEAVDVARESGCRELALLHCVSGYPAPASEYNLATLADLKNKFSMPIGLSDHTLDNTTAVASVALGASIIEKHVTLNRADGGPDDSFSLEPEDLRQLCDQVGVAWQAVGQVNYNLTNSESSNIKFRRSLYFKENVKAGTTLTAEHIASVRPGYGLAPRFYYQVLGKKLVQDVDKGTPMKLEHVQ